MTQVTDREAMGRTRTPEIYADAARIILERAPATCTGNTYLVEDVLAQEGITDLAPYSTAPGAVSYTHLTLPTIYSV